VLADKHTAHLAAKRKFAPMNRSAAPSTSRSSSEDIRDRDGRWKRRERSGNRHCRASKEHDKLVEARRDLKLGHEALTSATFDLFTQAAVFAPYRSRRPAALLGGHGIRALAASWPMVRSGASGWRSWPTTTRRPTPWTRSARSSPRASPRCSTRSLVATQGGRAYYRRSAQNAVDRMWNAYREFENALKAARTDTRPT